MSSESSSLTESFLLASRLKGASADFHFTGEVSTPISMISTLAPDFHDNRKLSTHLQIWLLVFLSLEPAPS